jgi:hypothetical protein
MEDRQDILLNEEGDLLINNGDLVVKPSDQQHIEHLLTAKPGDLKFTPILGADIMQSKNGKLTQSDITRVRKHLGMDGYRNMRIALNSEGDLEIEKND